MVRTEQRKLSAMAVIGEGLRGWMGARLTSINHRRQKLCLASKLELGQLVHGSA